MRRYMKILLVFVITGILLPITWFAVGIDMWTAESLNPVFEIIFVSLGIAIGTAVFLNSRHWAVLILPVLYVLFIFILPFLNLNAVKPTCRALKEITPGMNEQQVRSVFNKNFPKDGPFKMPNMGSINESRMLFVVDPNDGCCDAAVVQINFVNGKCASTEFMAD